MFRAYLINIKTLKVIVETKDSGSKCSEILISKF